MIEAALLQPVAQALKLFGNNGTIVVKLHPDALTFFQEREPVFAIMEGLPVPFFIASIQTRGNDRAHILFDSIYREEQARELLGKTLYQIAPKRARDKGIQKNVDDPSLLVEFSVLNSRIGILGKVDAFMDWELNPCLSIRRVNSAETFLVPFQDAFIVGIDLSTKQISISLPEGFLEIFTESNLAAKNISWSIYLQQQLVSTSLIVWTLQWHALFCGVCAESPQQ